jgi:ABC-type Fe3+-siderophore transport system permease subunit
MARYFFISILILAGALSAASIIGPGGFDLTSDLILTIRVPRVLTAAFAGAATATAGALSQSLFRNALATPSIIGTEAGAAFALALATLLSASGGAELTVASPVIFTTMGAALATIISLTLVRAGNDPWQNGSEGLGRLLLGGFALNALLAAGTSLCVSILMERGDGMSLYHWLMGSFSARTWDQAWSVIVSFVLCLIASWRLIPSLDALSLGDDAARSIGISVNKVRTRVLLLIAVLIGTSLSFGGALPFVGLIAPHFARVLTKPHLKVALPFAAIIGAILAVAADLAARTLRAPVDMDVGILTTMIGAPYFIWLLVSDSRIKGGARE